MGRDFYMAFFGLVRDKGKGASRASSDAPPGITYDGEIESFLQVRHSASALRLVGATSRYTRARRSEADRGTTFCMSSNAIALERF